MSKRYESVTKQITFPKVLMDRVDAKASNLGYSFPAYVRYVLAKEVEEKQYPVLDGVVMDDDMVDSIRKGIDEYKQGKTVELKNNKEIEEYFSKISNGEN